MRTLVNDTATKACSVALYDDHAVVASSHEVIGRGHAERLLPLIAALPDRGRAEQIMVDVGPGSFTGIRVGVAAARALALAWGIPVFGYGCLDLVAAMARADVAQAVDVVMSGGHGEYFFQHFDAHGFSPQPAVSLTPAGLEQALSATVVAGDSGLAWSPQQIDLLPDASQWYRIANVPPLTASPVYGRAPDAKLPKDKAA
jgi:tRNA threonylcarbamoyl adenosine modification protein YeaZ